MPGRLNGWWKFDGCLFRKQPSLQKRSELSDIYRHENVLVCELICMRTGVLFIHASNCTYYFLYHITLQVRSIEMYLIFILLCSLHSSVLCGLPLDMCDIWSVVYARRTYYISFHMPLIAQSSFHCIEMHQEQADFSTVKFMILVYERLVCISCQPEIIHVVSYTSYYTLLHHCLPVDILYDWVWQISVLFEFWDTPMCQFLFCSCWV